MPLTEAASHGGVGAANDRRAVTLLFTNTDHRGNRKPGPMYEVTLLGNKHTFRDAARVLWKVTHAQCSPVLTTRWVFGELHVISYPSFSFS